MKLAERLRLGLGRQRGLEEKKMFGGVGFLINGNLACGVHGNELIVRVDPEKHAQLLKRPHAKPFDMTGRPMKGWLMVGAAGCKTDKQLNTWIQEGVGFAVTLPPK